ncbi:uncharacterized protein IWZ02DRAFT_307743 [Phyllosticta citriasiana]|uniref:uncharacterized protein n=1 Tax=Phyllosticta citriasiana TaxID=595635 RepID=UPI0030FD5009
MLFSLRVALQRSERSLKSIAANIKTTKEELERILVKAAGGLPENTVEDFGLAGGQPSLENVIAVCATIGAVDGAWEQCWVDATQQTLNSIRELRQPVGRSLYTVHTTLELMFSMDEFLDFASVDAITRDLTDKIMHDLVCGKKCVDDLIKNYKDQMISHQASDLKPFLLGAQQVLAPGDGFSGSDSKDDEKAAVRMILEQAVDGGDQAKFEEALKTLLVSM